MAQKPIELILMRQLASSLVMPIFLAVAATLVGWGHSALDHTLAFARLADERHLVTFHHDPAHSDDDIDRLTAEATALARPSFGVTSGAEGAVIDVGGAA